MDALSKRRRLDWELVPPPKPGCEEQHAEARDALDHAYRHALSNPTDARSTALVAQSEARLETVSLFKCDVVDAPRVDDDPDWESRVIDEYSMLDAPMELEDYIQARRDEPDCDHCPYASRYSVFPMSPCEFSAGGLYEILEDHEDLRDGLDKPMGPAEMLALADRLSKLIAGSPIHDLECVDTHDYIDQAAQFLRFWARHGFAVRPVDMDGDLVVQAHAEMMAGGAGSTLH